MYELFLPCIQHINIGRCSGVRETDVRIIELGAAYSAQMQGRVAPDYPTLGSTNFTQLILNEFKITCPGTDAATGADTVGNHTWKIFATLI